MHADNPELLKAQELGWKFILPEFLYEQSKSKNTCGYRRISWKKR
jgi:hypothetical protein